MGSALRRPGRLIAGFAAVVLLAAGAWLWARLASPLVLDAPPPKVVADLKGWATVDAASVIDARVTYNLAAAVESLESAVPRSFGDIEKRLPAGRNDRVNLAFALARSPFEVRLEGQALSLSTVVEYEGRIWYRPPIGPELSAGCGNGAAPRPRIRATLVSLPRLTPDWQIRTRTRVVRLEPFSKEPRDRCRLTMLRLDETNRVIDGTREMLDRNLLLFDRAVSRWPARPKFARLWRLLQRPIRLADNVYLEINPYAAQLGPAGADQDTASVLLRLIASPQVVTGARPDSVRPLPKLQTENSISHLAHVTVEASFTYPVASTLLRHALVGRSIVQAGHRLKIRDVELTGIGGGRVALGLTLAGRVRGRLYFTGTPSLDSFRHEVSVPDLDYDVGTSQLLVRGFGWLQGVEIRDFLRERARLPDSTVIGRLRWLAESGMNRTLAPGVALHGRIHDARGTSVRATRREVRVRAVADAEFTLAIDRVPTLPRVLQKHRTKDEAAPGRGEVPGSPGGTEVSAHL